MRLDKQELLIPANYMVPLLVSSGLWMLNMELYCSCHSDDVSVFHVTGFCVSTTSEQPDPDTRMRYGASSFIAVSDNSFIFSFEYSWKGIMNIGIVCDTSIHSTGGNIFSMTSNIPFSTMWRHIYTCTCISDWNTTFLMRNNFLERPSGAPLHTLSKF